MLVLFSLLAAISCSLSETSCCVQVLKFQLILLSPESSCILKEENSDVALVKEAGTPPLFSSTLSHYIHTIVLFNNCINILKNAIHSKDGKLLVSEQVSDD